MKRTEPKIPNGLNYKIVDDRVIITKSSVIGSLIIPEFIENLPVTEIEAKAFYFCVHLKSVNIPEGVTEIGDKAFDYCKHLTSVIIPASVAKIGSDVFFDCYSLTEIQVADDNLNYKSIDNVLFSKDGKILVKYPNWGPSEYRVPDGVTEIAKYAFLDNVDLRSIIIPNGVTTIGECAFRYHGTLESIIIPETVTKIEYRTFFSCKNLTSVTIPASVTEIDSEAFYISDQITIHCFRNSYAQRYADELEIRVVIMDK
ncbi:MAG: leucine-rich repeat domain-containing protein [Planctomycetia bacterium]|nr:leucine-rich repeat domain-containing protein [Planctomycetia bacterium]